MSWSMGSSSDPLRIFDAKPSYDEWCEANGLSPDDDDNYASYCEWVANSY